MISWQGFPLQRGLGAQAAAWDALNARLFNSHPLLTSQFVNDLLQHFAQGDELLCVGHHALGGPPVAMCILCQQRPGVWRSWVPAQAQLGPSLLPGQPDLPGLMRALPGKVLRLDLLCLDPQVTDLAPLAGALTEFSAHALTMAVDLRSSYAQWWAARPKKLRDNLTRYLRRASAECLVPRFAAIDQPDQVAQAVRRYGQLEASGWKGRSGTAVDERSGQLEFYVGLMSRLAAAGQARVHELWLGNTLVASRLTMAQNGMVVALKTTYDEQYKRFAPGRLLMHEVIRDAFHLWPGSRLEFYTNASPDQLAWADSRRTIVHLTAYCHRNAQRLEDGRRRLLTWLHRLKDLGAKRWAQPHRTVEVYTQADELPDDVRSLFGLAEGERVGNGLAWYANLERTVLHGHTGVRYLVLRRAGQAVAALPVLEERAPEPALLALGNYYTTLYTPVLLPGESATVLVPLVRALRRQGCQAPLLRFAPMAPDSPGYTALRTSLRACGLPTFEFFCHGNWYLPVSTDWPGYLAQRGGQLRTNIARGEKRLASRGASIEIVTGGPGLDDAIAAYQQVYSASWKKPEPHPEFMPGLIRLCAERGWLRLGVVRVDGLAIAAQVWIVANGRADIYKLAYDEAHKPLGAGTVLTARLFEHAITTDRVTEIDYLIGDDPYKAAWMTHRRERWGLVAYNRRTLRGCLGWLRELAGRVRKALGPHTLPGASVAAAPTDAK